MEKNLSFFEAWRAKRKEKKNEEAALKNVLPTKSKTSVLAKYLKLREQDETIVDALETSSNAKTEVFADPDKKEAQKRVRNGERDLMKCGNFNAKPSEFISTKKEKNIGNFELEKTKPSYVQLDEKINSCGDDVFVKTREKVAPTESSCKFSMDNSYSKDSWKYSSSAVANSNSPRSSLIMPSLNSVSNIQEQLQLSVNESEVVEKQMKMNKLNETVRIIDNEPCTKNPMKTSEHDQKVGLGSQKLLMTTESVIPSLKFAEREHVAIVRSTETINSDVCLKDLDNKHVLKHENSKQRIASKDVKTFENDQTSLTKMTLVPVDESDSGGKIITLGMKDNQLIPVSVDAKKWKTVQVNQYSLTEPHSTPDLIFDNISKQMGEAISAQKTVKNPKSQPKASLTSLKSKQNHQQKVLKIEGGSEVARIGIFGSDKNAESKSESFCIKNELSTKEVIKARKNMTEMTKQVSQLMKENKIHEEKSEESKNLKNIDLKSDVETYTESTSLKKDPKKVLNKLNFKSSPNEYYPKSQKLLTSKLINMYEEANMNESKCEAAVSPSKIEAFLREASNLPAVAINVQNPLKMTEAVVEEIVTTKSEKSKHEKPVPQLSQMKYSSRGEVILGSVSIKPSNKTEACETLDTLSAITLLPAVGPEKSFFNENKELKEEKNCYALETFNTVKEHQVIENATFLPPLEENTEKTFERERSSFSPLSDFSNDSCDHYEPSVDYSTGSSAYSRRRPLRSSPTPRRIFPQVVASSSLRGFKAKEDSPVVFNASLSFDLSSKKSSLRNHFKPQPAFSDLKTNSSLLSLRIADFLKRTDHIMDEWKNLGRGTGNDLQSLVELPSKRILGQPNSKCKSATNIMIRGLLNYSKGSKSHSVRSRSTAKTSENSDRTMSDIDELSEITMDLTEERAASTIIAERLEAETTERVKLEQELSEIQHEKKNLQQASEKLEMELFYARSDANGLSESEIDLEDGGGDAALYKSKCERAMRELEFTRRRLQQQHEDDLEQLVGLKKQLEKKLTDAYEEVEEQRQVAGQWKRKVQKIQSEMSDLRLLLEEQSSRNNLLEKKQRKFDSEIQMLQEELRSEKNQKERLSREKEMAYAENYSLEQNLSSVRLELELKEEKVAALTRELEEFGRGGSEQEMAQLRKLKHDLEMKLKEQEEELDELAGQVSMLEGNKLRLEMSLESLRKEHRREMAQRDDELDEVRANAQKKIKILESQLESEHEERTLLVKEKHELERRLADAEESGRHYKAADEDALHKARRDLKKTKALLRDSQVMLERAKQDSPSKAILRALKNQLEDAESARVSALKAKQSLESELSEVNGQLEETLRVKNDAENRCQAALRETNALRTQVDENEEELAELLKKYRQTVQQLSAEQLANQEIAGTLAEAEAERSSLRDQLLELTAKLEANTITDPIGGITQKKLEIRIKELESRLDLEQTTRGRLEVQIARLKENIERLNEECLQARTKEQTAIDLTRKLQRSLREAKEELTVQQTKEQEAIHKRKELEKRLETAEHEASTARTDLRLAVKRIEDLQSAISGEIGSDSDRSESDEEDSGDDSVISHIPSTSGSISKTSRTPVIAPR